MSGVGAYMFKCVSIDVVAVLSFRKLVCIYVVRIAYTYAEWRNYM